MTREDRLSEIDDHVGFLDALDAQLRRSFSATAPRVTVLGFSQGAATAARWIERGRVSAQRLVLWGGLLPPDLDLPGHADVFRTLELIVAAGDGDAHLPPAALAEQRERLARHGLQARELVYVGGHEITSAALAALA
jgi:predicted esterase